jgi:hypothetical protein
MPITCARPSLPSALALIPNNPSRALKYPLDKHLYAQRHLVECCFSKLKQFRRVATRFERPPKITGPSSPSQPPPYGYEHYLGSVNDQNSRTFDRSSFEIMRPPSEIEGTASASDPLIDEAKSLYLLSVVDITEVDNNRSRHFLL